MKKKGYYIVAIIAIFFIGMNLYLLLKEDSKAERTVYVSEWSRIVGGDVVQTFETDGVALPDSEQYVYFDGRQGNMASFYVEEGDIITAGTPLFSYDTKELEEQKKAAEIEIERLEEELESVELHIKELNKIEIKAPSRNNSSQEEVTVVVDVTTIAESNIEESIAAAKADEGKIEAELTAAKKRLAQVNKRMDDVTVFSEADGQVIRINEDLTAPIMTIASANLEIEGILSEQQMKDVKVGQKVTIYSELHNQSYNGIISKINQYPKEAPDVGTEPIYSFITTLEEETAEDDLASEEVEEVSEDSVDLLEDEKEMEENRLLVGTNLQLNVIVNEAIAVPIISSDSAFSASGKKYVYKLTANGVIEKREIIVGLTFEGDSEVESGLIFNEVIAANPKAIPHENAFFILPMQTVGLQAEELRKMTKKQYAKYILMGLMEN